MKTTHPGFDRIAYALITLMVFAGAVGLASAQDVASTVPDNASARVPIGQDGSATGGFVRLMAPVVP